MADIYIATCLAWRQGNALLQALAQHLQAELLPWQEIIPERIGGAALLPLAAWDYSEQPQAYLDWLAALEAAQVRLINPRAVQTWNIRKSYLADLYAQGLPVTPSIVLSAQHRADWQKQIAAAGWENPVIKPLIGQSGKGVQRLAQMTNLNSAYPQGALLQAFIHAPFGEVCLIYLQGEYFHAVHRRPAPQEWRANSAYGVEILPISVLPHWRKAADRLMQALPFQPAYARIDGLIQEDNAFICNEIELIEPALYLPPERIGEAAKLLLQ